MTKSIAWEKDMAEARKLARTRELPILLFFHNPDCFGCQQMDAVTYPDKRVSSFIEKNFIPLWLEHDAKPFSSDFNIRWTPTIIILGVHGREHHRTLGFLDPADFIANGLLGLGKFHFDNERFPEALVFFGDVIASYPKNDNVAEAIFLSGVSRYKQSGHRQFLKETYETLSSKYPDNEWTKRAYPYSLL